MIAKRDYSDITASDRDAAIGQGRKACGVLLCVCVYSGGLKAGGSLSSPDKELSPWLCCLFSL